MFRFLLLFQDLLLLRLSLLKLLQLLLFALLSLVLPKLVGLLLFYALLLLNLFLLELLILLVLFLLKLFNLLLVLLLQLRIHGRRNRTRRRWRPVIVAWSIRGLAHLGVRGRVRLRLCVVGSIPLVHLRIRRIRLHVGWDIVWPIRIDWSWPLVRTIALLLHGDSSGGRHRCNFHGRSDSCARWGRLQLTGLCDR